MFLWWSVTLTLLNFFTSAGAIYLVISLPTELPKRQTVATVSWPNHVDFGLVFRVQDASFELVSRIMKFVEPLGLDWLLCRSGRRGGP